MAFRDELVSLIASNGGLVGEISDDASLIESGLVDSRTLYHLALLIEREIGAPLDLTAFDLAKEWDTIARVLRFVEAYKSDGRDDA